MQCKGSGYVNYSGVRSERGFPSCVSQAVTPKRTTVYAALQ